MQILDSKELGSNLSNVYYVTSPNGFCVAVSVRHLEKEWWYEVYDIPDFKKRFTFATPADHRLSFCYDDANLLALFFDIDDVSLERVAIIKSDGSLEELTKIPLRVRLLLLDKVYFYQETSDPLISFYDRDWHLQFSVSKDQFNLYKKSQNKLAFDGEFAYWIFPDVVNIYDAKGNKEYTLKLPVTLRISMFQYRPHIEQNKDSFLIYGLTSKFAYVECTYTERKWGVRDIFIPPAPVFDLYRYMEHDGNIILHGTAFVEGDDDKLTTFCYLFRAKGQNLSQTIFSKTMNASNESALGEIVWLNNFQFIYLTKTSKISNLRLYSISPDMKKRKIDKLNIQGFIMRVEDIICVQDKIYILVRHYRSLEQGIFYEIVTIQIPSNPFQ